MGHEITAADGVFLSNNKPAWHGLGHVFEGYPSRSEAQAIAHPWEPVEEPLYVSHMDMNDDEVREGFAEVPNHKAIVRSDNSQVIGVVGEGYTPVSNNAMWDIAEALEQSGDDVMFETGGSLSGGSRVWLLLKLKDPISVPGDPNGLTIPYFTLQNSHNGSGAFRGQATMTRIVCANTAHIADLDAESRGTNFTFRHTKNAADRIEQARQAVQEWRSGIVRQQEHYEYLLGLGVADGGVQRFVEEFIPDRPGIDSDRQAENIREARSLLLSTISSESNEGIEHTAYGLVQGVIEYAEHVRRAQSAESRFTRSFLDQNKYVRSAVALAEEVSA